MSNSIHHPITDDLLAVKGHITTQPSHMPGNLIAAVSWHAIGVHYHVSQVILFLVLVLTLVIQQNVLQWEQADLPWELPNYIGNFMQALKETQAWIMTGG